jgi:hypothetical protein
METKDDLELFMKQLLVNDPNGNVAISYQSLLTEMAKLTNSPKTLLESLDINEKWLTIKNLSKILVVSKTKNSLIKLYSAEEVGALGNKYEFKGIVGDTIEYVFDLDRNRDESVKGEDYYKLTMKQPRRNELLIQRAWINDPLRLISMMEQLIMS